MKPPNQRQPSTARLDAYSNGRRHGEIGGINIDLRHENLDPDDWTTDTLGLGDDGLKRKNAVGPFIWFPWFGPFEPYLEARLTREKARYKWDKRRIAAHSLALTPDIFLLRGDSIAIWKVRKRKQAEPTILDDIFRDGEVRLAYLKVIRANGVEENIKKPIQFRARDRLSDDVDGNSFFRLRRHMRAMLSNPAAGEIENDYVHRACKAADRILHRAIPFRNALKKDDGSEDYRTAATVLDLIEDSVNFGSLWA